MSCARRISLGFAIASAAVMLASGCGQVEVPQSFETFNAKDGKVQLKRPAGWEQKRGTAKKFRSVLFQSGPAKIRVLADITGSLVAGPNPQATEDVPEELTPVAAVHEDADELQVRPVLQVRFDQRRPSPAHLALDLGVAVTGEIHQAQVGCVQAQVEEVHQAGFAGSL